MGKRHPVGYYADEWMVSHHTEFHCWKDFLNSYPGTGNRAAIKAYAKRSLGIEFENPREQYDEEWILRNWEIEKNWNKLYQRYNAEHGKSVSYAAFKSYCNRHLKLNFKYSDEEKEWLKENYPKIGKNEIAEKFNEQFQTGRSKNGVYVKCKKLGVKVNEDRKELQKQRVADIRKQPTGHIAERERGKLYIKTETGWRRLDEMVIGKYPGKIIIHLDGNQKNCDPANLMHITKGTSARMTKNQFWSEEPEITRTGVMCCELEQLLKEGEA